MSLRDLSQIQNVAGLQDVLHELQGITFSEVAGATNGTKMNIAALRPEDTILSVLYQSAVTVEGVSEVQHITVDATGGHYTITWNAQTTGNILATAAASVVQAALEALSNIAVGDVVVSGGPGDSGGNTPYVLTWAANLGDVAQPTVTNVDLSGGGTTVSASTVTPGVQQQGGAFADDKANVTIQDTHASGVVTVSGVNDADTVTANGVVYTFKDTPTAATHVKRTAGNDNANAAALAATVNSYENRRLSTGQWNTPAIVASVLTNAVTFKSVTDGAGNSPVSTENTSGTTITVADSGTPTVTVTFSTAVEDNALVVNGVTFTVKDTPGDLSPAPLYGQQQDPTQVKTGGTNAIMGANMAAAINFYEDSKKTLDVAATDNADGTITLVPRTALKGNAIGLVSSNGSRLAVTGTSSSRLSGGTATGGIKSTTNLANLSVMVLWLNKN